MRQRIVELALDVPELSPRELAEGLGIKKMGHVRGAPFHPQTQGKIAVSETCFQHDGIRP